MKPTDRRPKATHNLPGPSAVHPARLGLAAALLLCLALFAAASAAAAPFEGVGCFAGSLPGPVDSCKPVAEEKFGEEVQLGGSAGMAVNYTGAGGVPKGTVYAASYFEGRLYIIMHVPEGDGLEFHLAWEVTALEGPYERCGPGLEPSTECKPRPNATPGFVDVDVDQSTGNVYAYHGEIVDAGRTLITAYTPEGEEVLSRFGELAPFNEKTAESPEKIHRQSPQPALGGIAVNDAGEVYVYNEAPGFDNFYHRLAKFEPKTPGNYEEYVYAGTAEDVGAGFSEEGERPAQPVMDAAGHIYVTNAVGGFGGHIEEYDPSTSIEEPICEFDYPQGGITAITVDPAGGEVFFFTYKKETGFKFKLVHQLGPCNEATGNFEGPEDKEEVGKFEVKPERADLFGLAFDPERELPGRAKGVLYGGAPSAEPDSPGKGEPGQSSLGYIFAAAAENPPVVESQAIGKVTATTAQLQAVIDPAGHPTDYAFEYLTEAAYQEGGESFGTAAKAPLGGATLENAGEVQSAAVTLTGLLPDTAYRFRVVAQSECKALEPGAICEDAGDPLPFKTYPAEADQLPDNRAWELVSPAEKHGGQVLPAEPSLDSCPGLDKCKPGGTFTHFPMQSSPDGDAVVYEGTPFGGALEGAAIENAYRSERTATGWVTGNPTPELLQSTSKRGYQAFSTDLTQGVLKQLNPALAAAAPEGYENLYAQASANPLDLDPFLLAPPPNRPAGGAGAFETRYAGAASDLSKIFFEANDALTGATGVAPPALDGGGAKFNLYEWEPASDQVRLVNVFPGNASTEPGSAFGLGSAHSISDDGSRAFWSSSTGQVYVREDAESTVEVPDPGKFLAAATDGSRVLLANGHLYDLEAEETIDLTAGNGGFQGLVGQSDDLTSVYFVATSVLTGEEANSEGDKATAGGFNLYAWSGGTTRFVGTLLEGDNGEGSIGNTWSSTPAARTAQASPSGRYLAFLTRASLIDYDNVGPCSQNSEGLLEAPCLEAYLYDSVTGELACASCNPSGAAPLGVTVLRLIANGIPSFLPQPHYLTDSGRLYFDSQDSLSQFDTNEGVEDVYQYEPQGVGTCKRVGGCVSLISAGTEGLDSNLLAVDDTGKNVFFTTRDRLRQQDKDELIDLYDAREFGGIAAETETQRPECQGETCQPPAFAPGEPNLGSSALRGAGNVKQEGTPRPRCPKGKRKARRKGKVRCVKRNLNRATNHKPGGRR